MKLRPVDKLVALYQSDICAFAHKAFLVLFPGQKFEPGWHVELLGSKLERARRRKTKRLCLHLPPRHSKSFMMAVIFPAWILGHDPSAKIFLLSYGQDLSQEHLDQVKRLMSSDFYQSVFPTRIDKARDTKSDFFTTENGRLLAESLGGVLTGRGADYILIDDPLKASEAYSDVRRNTVNENMYKSVRSRLNNQDNGVIVIAMQRLHPDDLAGHVQAKGGWEVLSLPLIAETDERYEFRNVFGKRVVGRKAGEVLQPKIVSLEKAEEIRRENPDHVFAAQWQQNPQPPGGVIVKRDMLKFYRPEELPREFQRVVQSWDTANKDSELANYSACVTFGVYKKRMYLLDVFRRRLEFPDLKQAVISQANLHDANIVLIEDKASGTSLIQDLKNDGFSRVQPSPKMDGDKVMRLHSQTGRIASGVMLLPENAYWLQEYLAELLSFPNSRFSDQVDATVYALEHHASASHYGWTEEGIRNLATIFENTDVHPLAAYLGRMGLL